MIEEILRARRSIRRYKPEAPPRDVIEKLIEMAVLAPSASNKQPWRFFVVTERATLERMARAVEEAVDRIAAHVRPEFEQAFRNYGGYFVRFREAPVVIVPVFRSLEVLSNLVDDALAADDRARIASMEFNSGIISTALAVENLMLYAHSIGLGTSCMTGPLVAADELKRVLEVPESWSIAALVPAGYPDETPEGPARKSAETVIRWK